MPTRKKKDYQPLANNEIDNPFLYSFGGTSEGSSSEENSTQHHNQLPENLPQNPAHIQTNSEKQTFMSALIKLFLILLINILVILTAFYSIPPLKPSEKQYLKLPSNLNESKILGNILHDHINQNYYRISLAHFLVIFFVHVFSVPGASFLAILAGFLYPQYYALAMVLFGSTIGCGVCYVIMDNVGTIVIRKYLKTKIDSWRVEVDKQKESGDLWSYFLFLRLTPFLPGWFINITSPLVKIPLKIFIIGTFFGISPQSYCFILAGTQLDKLITVGDAFSYKSIIIWSFIAFLSIIPVILKKCCGERFGGGGKNGCSVNDEFKLMQQNKIKEEMANQEDASKMKRLKSEPCRDFTAEQIV